MNDIGDEGMAMISEALQHNTSLTILVVEKCGLSVKGIVMLATYSYNENAHKMEF